MVDFQIELLEVVNPKKKLSDMNYTEKLAEAKELKRKGVEKYKLGDNEKIIEQNKTLNLAKSNDDFFKYKKRKILRIIKENEKENKENNECNTFDDKEKRKNKKIFYLKNLKKKGIFIRKVIREEKYIIDDDGTEKLIDIKQSTYDTHGNKKKIKKINVNKIIK